MISSVYDSTRDGSAFCIIFLYLLIRAANKSAMGSLNSDTDGKDPNLPPHLVPLLDVYQSIVRPELEALKLNVPLTAKDTTELHQFIYSALNTKLDDKTAQEIARALTTFLSLNNYIAYSPHDYTMYILPVQSLPLLPESISKISVGLQHVIVKGLILPLNAINAKVGLRLTNPKTLIIHADLESKIGSNSKRSARVVYSTTEERISIEEEDKKILTSMAMKIVESGASIVFITQSVGPVVLDVLTNYGVLVFHANENHVKSIKKHITTEEYWSCGDIKPAPENQQHPISDVIAHYGPFAPIIADTTSNMNKEEQWALIYTAGSGSSANFPPNLISRGLGLTELCKQTMLLVSNSMATSIDGAQISLHLLGGGGQWMNSLIKRLKIAASAIDHAGHVLAIDVIVEALSGVHHQLANNIRSYTNQFEENSKPAIVDSYFVVDKMFSTTLEIASVLMRIDQIIKPQIVPVEFLQESINKQTQATADASQQNSNLYREEEQHAKESMRLVGNAVPQQERERIRKLRAENEQQQHARVKRLENLLQDKYGDMSGSVKSQYQ